MKTTFSKAALLLLFLLSFSPGRAATNFIQDVMVIGGAKEDVLIKVVTYNKQGWSYIDQDLNEKAGGDYIFLLYKKNIRSDEFSDGGITGFYIYSWNGSSQTPPDTKTIDGRTYYLVPCEGSDTFVNSKGDLNRGCGSNSDYIYLYYTRDPFPDNHVVTGISFNNTQSGALGTNGGTTGYDLNNKAGGDYIYMHVATATKLAPLQIGDGESGTNAIPFYLGNTNYPYSVSQQIYMADEIGKAGTIKAISFYHRPAVTTLSLKGVQILMKHTEKDSFAGRELDPMADFTKVYEGDVSFSGGGWVTIHLDAPFNYDGNSNLMICCYEPSSTHSSGNTFTYHYADNKLRRTASESAIDINTTLAGSGNLTMRNDIQLNLVPNPCGNPSALTLTNATDNTAAFSWSPPKGTHPTITGYAWQYKKADDASWSALTTTTSTTASVSGLSPYTEYIFRVKTLYGSNESSYSILRFLTAVNLPYSMGFENGMPGWSEVDINVYYNIIYTGIYAEARHDGAYGYQFRCYEVDPKDQYLISPALPDNTPVDVSFYYRNHWQSSPETFQVGYSTSTRDTTAFTWGEAITEGSSDWKKYEQSFPSGTKYVAVRYTSNNYWFDLDDFEFVAHSDFAKPTDLSVDELGDQSVKLKWTGPSGATGYACQYKVAEGDEWSAETPVSGTSFTLSGLTANTTYDFRVKAFHGSNGTNASNFETIRFMTEGPMESLPHFQDFESGMGGWRVENGHGRTGITTQERHEGAYGFEFDSGSAQYLRSPLLEGDSPKILTFYAKPYTDTTGTTVNIKYADFTVGWSTKTNRLTDFEGMSTAVEVTDYRWCRYSIQLPEEARYACIKAGIHFTNWLYIDDISISVITLPEAVEATVMGETKYVTTFYDKDRSWKLPKGTLAYQVSGDLVFYRIGSESDIVPAGMAVVIVADKTPTDTDTRKTIHMTLTSTTDLHHNPVNILLGSDSVKAVSDGKIDGKTVYVLGIVDGKLDFYPFTGSEIPAGKAYYLGE